MHQESDRPLRKVKLDVLNLEWSNFSITEECMKGILFIALIANTAWASNFLIEKNISLVDKKICFIGDTGTGKEDQYTVAKALEAEGCHQIRIAGDIIYEKGLSSASDELFIKNFLNPYKNLIEAGVTFHVVTGNHDYLGKQSAWNDLHQKFPWLTHPNLYYAEKYQDICFINIETTPISHGYRLSYNKKQKKWLREMTIGLREKCKVAIMMGHHPNWSAGSHGNANKRFQSFTTEYISGKFDAYIAGHDHNLSHEGYHKETVFMVSGAAGKLRPLKYKPRGPFAKSELGYLVVTIEKSHNEYMINYAFRGVDQKSNSFLLFEEVQKANGVR
jgi:predicted phosphodiesterase